VRAAVDEALATHGVPQIHSNDHGAPFTSREYVQRLWRTVKYECLYLREHVDERQLRKGLSDDWRFSNEERPHQALGNRIPQSIEKPKTQTINQKLSNQTNPPHNLARRDRTKANSRAMLVSTPSRRNAAGNT